MKFPRLLAVACAACLPTLCEAEEWLDQLSDTLTFTALDEQVRLRLSGTIDLEFYRYQQPAPGAIYSTRDELLNPRFSLFLDAQLGPAIYFFAQARLDRGFDPGDGTAQVRLDESALRVTPWEDGRFSFQVGQFAMVVGNWAPRHLSWENPFVTAPLPYENITALEEVGAPASPQDFLVISADEKYDYNPVIWGPGYATGVSISGRIGRFDYAAELKNTALSSRPEVWPITATGFGNPTVSGRLGFRPNTMWNLGLSASNGPYFQSSASPTLPPGRDIGDYRQLVFGQDISFAWRHLQLWAEFYQARFAVPRVGHADTFAYYLEVKYKFAPQLFGALRWNQQLFATIPDGAGGRLPWGNDLWRVDTAVGYRFTAHSQLKLQYSFQHETDGPRAFGHIFAAQFTVRF